MPDPIAREIVGALRRAFGCFESGDEAGFALHCGRAGGMAAASGTFGIRALELCDDISDAYESGDRDLLGYILSELAARPDATGEHSARTRGPGMDWPVYNSVISEALRSHDDGDALRHSLMIGFTLGLMARSSGMSYDVADVVDGIVRHDGSGLPGSKPGLRERVIAAMGTETGRTTLPVLLRRGHDAGCRELIEWVRARVAAGVRLSDPTPFMSADEAARYYQESLRTMRWTQNFGLRAARARDESVTVPNSMSINYHLATGGAVDTDAEDE